MRATQESWQTTPLPEPRRAVALSRRFSAAEYERIRQGSIPSDQDDRWFVWVGDDDVVHLHRSWTGFEIYQARLRKATDGYDLAEAWSNADPDQHAATPQMDQAQLEGLLDNLARGVGP